jgi:queuine tRNA-ribosyltransferase
MKPYFDIPHSSSKTRARRGVLSCAHGVVQTPAFVTVGTKATVKALTPEDLTLTGTQYIFVNTYHMVLAPGENVVQQAGGVHTFSHMNVPIITDSGGFQVFSLGKHLGVEEQDWNEKQKPTGVKISEDGVQFRSHIDGKKVLFTPEFSISAQKKIGADFIVAFDEDILNKASEKYTKESTERTHLWAQRSLAEFERKDDAPSHRQRMYGVIHGGRFEDLRKWSAQTIAEMPFECLALGGVSVGIENKELREEVSWVSDVLHTDQRPRHLLGISTLPDVIFGVKKGFDTFDCVLPTRYARMGRLYDADYHSLDRFEKPQRDVDFTLDIMAKKYKSDMGPISEYCECHVCKTYSRAYLHHLFSQRELLGYRLATIHNLYWIEQFFGNIRKSIEGGKM